MAATIPVEATQFTDERQVNVTLDVGTPAPITSPRAGTITATYCAPGEKLGSGAVIAVINDQPIALLHTKSPLWRDMEGGETGADVDALIEELTRLGYTSSETRSFDWGIAEALHRFYSDRGIEDDFDGLRLDRIIWVAEPIVTLGDCPSGIGASVQAGSELAKLQQTIQAAVIAPMPGDLRAGDRVLIIGETHVPIDATGRSTGPVTDLANEDDVIAYMASKDGKLGGKLALSAPLDVIAVPSASVFGTTDRQCIADGNRTYVVQVVASRLGSTLVEVEGKAPKTVLVNPKRDEACG